MLPFWFASSLADSARLIDPASRATRRLGLGGVVLSVLGAWRRSGSACLRGGRIRSFLVPRPIQIAAAGAGAGRV